MSIFKVGRITRANNALFYAKIFKAKDLALCVSCSGSRTVTTSYTYTIGRRRKKTRINFDQTHPTKVCESSSKGDGAMGPQSGAIFEKKKNNKRALRSNNEF